MGKQRLLNARYVFLLSSAIVLLLAFQNCHTSDNFQTSQSSSTKDLESIGNGTGYDGKPVGLYFNYVPDFKCNGDESFFASLKVEGNILGYLQNTQGSCGSLSQNLSIEQLTVSPYQNRIVGYQDKIFEYSSTTFTRIPDKLVEAWCFNDAPTVDFEIIQEYSRSLQSSTGEFFSSIKNSLQHQREVATSRIINTDQFRFVSDLYELRVDRTKFNPETGLFDGVIHFTQDNQYLVDANLKCRLGGYLKEELSGPSILSAIDFAIAKEQNKKSILLEPTTLITSDLEKELQLQSNEHLNPKKAFYLDSIKQSFAISFVRDLPESPNSIEYVTQILSSWQKSSNRKEFQGQIDITEPVVISGNWAHLRVNNAPTTTNYSPKTSHFIQGSSALNFPLEPLSSVLALTNEGEFLGLNSRNQLLKVHADRTQGLRTEQICSAIQNIQSIWQSMIDPSYIIFYSHESQRIRFWKLILKDLKCLLINDLPMRIWDSTITTHQIVPSPNLLSIIVITTNIDSGLSEKILWIPLNGKAAIDITPANSITLPGATEVFFSLDSQKIYFSQQPFLSVLRSYWSWIVPRSL